MAKGKNNVSFWFWFFALFVLWLPCIGIIVAIICAFFGDNETKKNFFRAWLAWILVIAVLSTALFAFGAYPLIAKQISLWLQQAK